jgi:hypothetical protein
MNGPQRFNYEQLRGQVDHELASTQMPEKLYKSTDSIFRMIGAIVKTDGHGWAAQALDNQGQPLLTPAEQRKLSDALEPYIPSIISYFGNSSSIKFGGAVYAPSAAELSGMSSDFIKSKIAAATGGPSDPTKMVGPDDLYTRLIKKVDGINTVINDYASKYGILKLEKEHDLEPDPRIIPEPVAAAAAEGLFAVSGIPPGTTMGVLSKFKIPFRLIIFGIYLALDVARIMMAAADRPTASRIMTVILAILELLRGDWKKATLTFIGFYGMTPLLAGQGAKLFLTLFRRLSPQLQENIIIGSLDATKSLVIGILLAIFQATAPEEVRLPIIAQLEKIAQKKAEMDGMLVEEGLSARPDYLSPTFEDLNNIQAVMSDKAYLCSCEFEELIKAVDKSPAIHIALQILRIPVSKEYRDYICGPEPCAPLVDRVVKESIENKKEEEQLQGPPTAELPVASKTIGGRRKRTLRRHQTINA